MDNATTQEAIDTDIVTEIVSEKDLEESANEDSDEPRMKIRKLEEVIEFLNNLK